MVPSPFRGSTDGMPILELYIFRHGIAAERGDEYPDDSKRPLTGQGITRLRKEAKALDALGVGFDQIVTSPLVRTRQKPLDCGRMPGRSFNRRRIPCSLLLVS
jgi:hypothetical protein